MKKVLIAATALTLLGVAGTPASARDKLCPDPNARCKVRDNPEFYKHELPRKILGAWCGADRPSDKVTRFARGRGCAFEISANGFGGEDDTCTFVDIDQVGNTYRTHSKCEGDGVKWEQDTTFWFEGRYLMMRTEPGLRD
jgi:hypothetical protein